MDRNATPTLGSALERSLTTVACPLCADPVRIVLAELLSGEPIRCPNGHAVPLHECPGMVEVVRFVVGLIHAIERAPS